MLGFKVSRQGNGKQLLIHGKEPCQLAGSAICTSQCLMKLHSVLICDGINLEQLCRMHMIYLHGAETQRMPTLGSTWNAAGQQSLGSLNESQDHRTSPVGRNPHKDH